MKIAVIGAGIAGLTAAYELQQAGNEVLVFEKESFVGGRMSTRVHNDYYFDIGADHLCDLYAEMKAYCKHFGIEWEMMEFLEYGIFCDGTIKKMYECISKLAQYRLAMYMIRLKEDTDFFDASTAVKYDTENAYDFFSKIAGKRAADYLADGMSSTYQFHRASDISKGMLVAYLQSLKHYKDLWHLHRTKGGMSALPEAFANALDVRLLTEVKEVIPGEQLVVKTDTDEFTFDTVVIATVAPVTKAILQNPTPQQANLLDQTEYAASISIAFTVDESKLPTQAVVWVPYIENQKISGYVNEKMKGEETVRDGKSLFCVWLHEVFAKSMMQQDDQTIFATVKQELPAICPWLNNANELTNHDLHRWHYAMPKFKHGHLTAVKQFLEHGQGQNNIYFAGDYLNAPWTEGALRNGKHVAQRIMRDLG